MMLRRIAPLLVLVLAVACSSAPRAADPSATANPDPSAGATVLGATYGSPLIAPVETVQVCTLVSIGEIESATGLSAGAPLPLNEGSDAPACSWTLDGTPEALVLTLAHAEAYPDDDRGASEDLGEGARWEVSPDGTGTMHVLLTARDRSMALTFAARLAIETRAAARELALAIIPRL